MAKRHETALFIAAGACNPSAIAHSIYEACAEMRAEPDHRGTLQIRMDPAIRLMVHQLAFLCDAEGLSALSNYEHAFNECVRLKGPASVKA